MTLSGPLVELTTAQPTGASITPCDAATSQPEGQVSHETEAGQGESGSFRLLLDAVLDGTSSQPSTNGVQFSTDSVTEYGERSETKSDADASDGSDTAGQDLITSMFWLTVPAPAMQPEPSAAAEIGLNLDVEPLPDTEPVTCEYVALQETAGVEAGNAPEKRAAPLSTEPQSNTAADFETEQSLQLQTLSEIGSSSLSDTAESGEPASSPVPTLEQTVPADITEQSASVDSMEDSEAKTATVEESADVIAPHASDEGQPTELNSAGDSSSTSGARQATRRELKRQTTTSEDQDSQGNDIAAIKTALASESQPPTVVEAPPATYESTQENSSVTTSAELITSGLKQTTGADFGMNSESQSVAEETAPALELEVPVTKRDSTLAFSVRAAERPATTGTTQQTATMESFAVDESVEAVVVRDADATAETDGRSLGRKSDSRSASAPDLQRDPTATETANEELEVSRVPGGAAGDLGTQKVADNSSVLPSSGVRTETSQVASGAESVVREALEVTEDVTPLSKEATVREFSLRVNESGDQRISLRVAEQAGEVRVDVRTAGRELASELRESLPDLVRNLTNRGYDAEARWSGPPEAVVRTAADTSQAGDSGSDGNSGDNRGSNWSGGGQSDGKQNQQDEQRWKEALLSGFETARGQVRSE